MRDDAKPYREVQLGLTLEDEPKLLMNNEILYLSADKQANASTIEKIGIGAGVVVVVAALFVGSLYLFCDADCLYGEGGD